jgi:mannose/fructose/N-acetylgalactosamine-specific phosphotransferase system component IIC
MSEKVDPRGGTLWDELKRPATAIAIAIAIAVLSTIVGLIISLYFYHKGEKRAEIAFKVEQLQVFDKNHVGVAPLTVHDEAGNVIIITYMWRASQFGITETPRLKRMMFENHIV